VLILQFLERVPDRQAVERVRSPLGWKLALPLSLSDPGFHPTTLVYLRQRLLEHAKSDLAFGAVLETLQPEGLLPKRCRQRLDSTQVVAAVANLSGLECVRSDAAPRLGRTGRGAARTVASGLLAFAVGPLRGPQARLPPQRRSPPGPIPPSRGRRVRPAALAGEPPGATCVTAPEVELLAEVLGQRFALKDNRPEPLEPSEGSAVQSPHDLRRAVRGQRPGQTAPGLARV